MTPKGCPNGCLYFLLASLGRPLGHHWCPKPFSNIPKTKKNSQRAPGSCKLLQKVTPEESKSITNCFEGADAFETWPGGLREALTINSGKQYDEPI